MFVEDNAGLVSSCKFQYIVLRKCEKSYRYDLNFSDRQFLANSADPDQTTPQSDQGIHFLQF